MADLDDPEQAFFALRRWLPRQGPGSDGTTRALLRHVGPLSPEAAVLDLGCGPGRASLALAAETKAQIIAIDLHQPFLDELEAAIRARGLTDRIRTANFSMADLPYPDASIELIWAESSVYNLGFDVALRTWRRLLTSNGAVVLTEAEWSHDRPSAQAREFFEPAYPLRTTVGNIAAAEHLGYRVDAVLPQPESDWWDEYYAPLLARAEAADLTVPGMVDAVAATHAEIDMRRRHGVDYQYTGYVLRPVQ